jgi:GTPase SAR1 family protein
MGACFQRYDCNLANGKTIAMDIWDTAGQERYRSLLVMYYKNSDVIIMVFDVTRQ